MADFEWFRSFVAVYRSGSVSGAAAVRHLTQPAISQHIAALEAEVGAPLFERHPRGMVPTKRGNELYSQVAPAVDALERVSQRLRGIPRTVLRVGGPAEFLTQKALPVLNGLSVPLSLSFGTPEDLVERLRSGELDLVIATKAVVAPGIDFLPLCKETFWLVGPGDAQPPAVDDRAHLERWLLAQPWIAYGPELPIIRRFWRRGFGHRPTLEPVLVVPDLRTIAELVACGYGLSVLPDYLCAGGVRSGRLRILWDPPDPVTNQLFVAIKRSDRKDELLMRAVDALLGLEGSGPHRGSP